MSNLHIYHGENKHYFNEMIMISALYETNMLSCILYSASQLNNYWTYDGSLTTPPYYESVKWIVFADVIEMSEDQVEYLKNG
jgi:hypothetical protein